MADLNEVRLIGRLTRDPDMRVTANGTSIATFGLATGRKIKGQDGVFRDETTFVDIVCWGKVAENVCKYMKKGRSVFVGGRLKLDAWDDKTTGQKRQKLSVVAEQVQFLDSQQKEQQQTEQPPAATPWKMMTLEQSLGMPPASEQLKPVPVAAAEWNQDEPPF